MALRQPADEDRYGVDSMPETAEHVAVEFRIERQAQDRMALASQRKALAAQKSGFFDAEIVPVTVPQKKGEPVDPDGGAIPLGHPLGASSAARDGRRRSCRVEQGPPAGDNRP